MKTSTETARFDPVEHRKERVEVFFLRRHPRARCFIPSPWLEELREHLVERSITWTRSALESEVQDTVDAAIGQPLCLATVDEVTEGGTFFLPEIDELDAKPWRVQVTFDVSYPRVEFEEATIEWMSEQYLERRTRTQFEFCGDEHSPHGGVAFVEQFELFHRAHVDLELNHTAGKPFGAQ